jgi:hypothetical protein
MAVAAWRPTHRVSGTERQRLVLASLPADDPLLIVERRRLIEAVEQVRRSAQLLGLDPIDQYASLALRADAWQHRVERGRRSWRALHRTPIFSTGSRP